MKIQGRTKLRKPLRKKIERLKEFNKKVKESGIEIMEVKNKNGYPFHKDSMFRNCKLLPEIIQKFKEGESSIQIARFLLDENTGETSIKNRYKNREKELAIKTLASSLRKFRHKVISDAERFPNFNFSVFVQRFNSSINEIAEMEKIIAYLFHRIDKWIEFEKTSPFPMKESREEVKLALESLHKLIAAKQSLGIEVNIPDTPDVNAEKSEDYQSIKEVLAELTAPERKKRVRELAGVPSLNRQEGF